MTKTDLITTVRQVFQQQLGYSATCFTQAPICVPMMGAFFDTDGKGLSCALEHRVVTAASQREDHLIRLVQAESPYAMDLIALDRPITPSSEYTWANGVRQALVKLQDLGYPFFGADIVIGHDLPAHLGLDHQLSMTLAALNSLVRLYSLPIDHRVLLQCAMSKGRLAQGMHILHAEQNRLGWLDPRQSYQGIDLPSTHKVMVMVPNRLSEHTRLHPLLEEEGVRWLGVKSFRDLTVAHFDQYAARVDGVTANQVRYGIEESHWTDAAARALKMQDWSRLNSVFLSAHQAFCQAMQCEYADHDILTHIILDVVGDQGAARTIQWGHQQAVVAIVPMHQIESIHAAVHERFELKTGVGVTYCAHSPQKGSQPLSLIEMAAA